MSGIFLWHTRDSLPRSCLAVGNDGVYLGSSKRIRDTKSAYHFSILSRHSRTEERGVWNLSFTANKRFPIMLVPRCRE